MTTRELTISRFGFIDDSIVSKRESTPKDEQQFE